ncbi:hypothetical protein P8Q88_11085 [Qipengyuania sp. XHP0207]|uniref:hypothetical protein n=1 Tax=Qipengyuania sp. XHP0207 TaxID=3038078 RepID=UPI00241CC534|nr:hypothetical protein [Qipengyuania sp. XHP0207]MDG5748716.1 hypothetical protein [Qipengyuania sp. XHP0207]
MDKFEQQAIDRLVHQTSPEDIRRVMENARDKSPAVHKAAFRRLVEVSAQDADDPISKACWEMVYTVEGIRKQLGRPVWRMNRLRPKIEKDGEIAALEYCARNRTDGFDEVLEYELAEFTAEAIILRFPDTFTDENLRGIARTRLVDAGVDVDAAVRG